MQNLSGSGALRSDGWKGWAARLSAVDVGGRLVQFDYTSAGGSGTTGAAFAPLIPTANASVVTNAAAAGAGMVTRRTTLAGCTCMARWYWTNADNSTAAYAGCALAPGWSVPGCQVRVAEGWACAPGSCAFVL